MIYWDADQLLISNTVVVGAVVAIFLWTKISNTQRKPKWPVVLGALPFLGNALSLSNSDDFVAVLSKWAKEFGKDGIYEFKLFGRRWICLCSADTFMQAMKLRPFKLKRAHMIGRAVNSMGIGGIFSSEGKMWGQERRIVAPALNQNHLVDYFPTMKVVAQRLVHKWEQGESIVTAHHDLSSFALDLIALSILGIDLDSLNNRNYPLFQATHTIFQAAYLRTLSPLPYWKIPLIGPKLDGGNDATEKVFKIIRGRIRDYRRKKDQVIDVAKKTFLEKAIDLADQENSTLDEDRMVGNMAQLILAGSDTSSNTAAFCLWELAHDKSELQDELWKEVVALNKDAEALTMEDVKTSRNFPRLRSFVWEMLRVKGPNASIFLEPSADLDFYGETISPGTILCILTRSLGEKADSEIPVGPNGEGPEQFCPRRWLAPLDQTKKDGPVTAIQPSNNFGGFMIFGHGARTCPGKSFAVLEILTILIFVLQAFEVAPVKDHPPLKVVSRFTETFDGIMRLSLKKRVQS